MFFVCNFSISIFKTWFYQCGHVFHEFHTNAQQTMSAAASNFIMYTILPFHMNTVADKSNQDITNRDFIKKCDM